MATRLRAVAAQVLDVQELKERELAECLLAAVVRANGSRQVVAATAAALWRCAAGRPSSAVVSSDDFGLDDEVEARMAAIQPIIRENVTAAVQERPPVVSGMARLRRNVATHAHFGGGADVVEGSVAELKKKQRGRRRTAGPGMVEGKAKDSKAVEDDVKESSVRGWERMSVQLLAAAEARGKAKIQELRKLTEEYELSRVRVAETKRWADEQIRLLRLECPGGDVTKPAHFEGRPG